MNIAGLLVFRGRDVRKGKLIPENLCANVYFLDVEPSLTNLNAAGGGGDNISQMKLNFLRSLFRKRSLIIPPAGDCGADEKLGGLCKNDASHAHGGCCLMTQTRMREMNSCAS